MSLVFSNFHIPKLSNLFIINNYATPNAIIIHFKTGIEVIFSKLEDIINNIKIRM